MKRGRENRVYKNLVRLKDNTYALVYNDGTIDQTGKSKRKLKQQAVGFNIWISNYIKTAYIRCNRRNHIAQKR
jgi:hypothetical protein